GDRVLYSVSGCIFDSAHQELLDTQQGLSFVNDSTHMHKQVLLVRLLEFHTSYLVIKIVELGNVCLKTILSFDFHSPTERLDLQLFQEKSIHVDIKRDDMIHPFISGNKWRKLKYVLHSAITKGKTHLVTFGGAWSNHLLATACAGARFGFNTTGIVRGEEVSNTVLS